MIMRLFYHMGGQFQMAVFLKNWSISFYHIQISKLKKGANVNTEILLKICIALECDISKIMEIIEE